MSLEALNKSIDHWEMDLLDVAKRDDWEDQDYNYGIGSCPLCKEYYLLACLGCPIMQVSGKSYCRDTPYGDVEEAIESLEWNQEDLVDAIQAEIDFLLDVRKKVYRIGISGGKL